MLGKSIIYKSVLGKSIIVLSKMFSTSTMLLFAENNALVILASSFNLYSIFLLKDLRLAFNIKSEFFF